MRWRGLRIPFRYRRKLCILCVLMIAFFLVSKLTTMIALSDLLHGGHQAQQDWMQKRMITPIIREYFLENPLIKDFSRGQSEIIDDLLQQKENGFFVDIGAGNGETNSVTLFFERERKWTGVLVEANGTRHLMSIVKNRQCHVWNFRITFDDAGHRVSEDSIKTEQLFNMINRKSIDLLSVNLHNQEIELLKAVDFVKYHIRVVTIELQSEFTGETYQEVMDILEANGYEVVHHLINSFHKKKDVIFVKL